MTEQDNLKKLYSDIVNKRLCDDCLRLNTFKPLLMNEDPRRRVMLIFECPGGNGNETESERSWRDPRMQRVEEVEKQRAEAVRQGDSQLSQLVDLSKEIFHLYWIESKHKNFFKRFFETLADMNVIGDFEDVNLYIQQRDYWKDFFITDAALCPGNRKRTLRDALLKCKGLLGLQIRMFEEAPASPKLIIPFGNEAFSSLRQIRGQPERCLPDKRKSDRITHCHGYVFQYDKFTVLPLLHPSRWYMTLRNSYFEYLRQALDYCRSLTGP